MYTIREAAARAGIPVSTLRAWERRYGIVRPSRSAAAYRLYALEELETLRRMRRLVDRGWTPSVAQEAIQMQTLVSLVSAGIGAAWVPQTVTRLQRPGVVYRRVAGDAVTAETSLVWREPAPPVVQHFVDQVRRAMRRQSRTV